MKEEEEDYENEGRKRNNVMRNPRGLLRGGDGGVKGEMGLFRPRLFPFSSRRSRVHA